MLRCATNTPEVEEEIRKAFEVFNTHGEVEIFFEFPLVVSSSGNPSQAVHVNVQFDFEHGQWHVTCLPCGRQWSVNDTESGFSFEEISHGDGYCIEGDS